MSSPGKLLTLNGRTQCIRHWAREYNIPVNTLRTRLERGDDLLTALTAPRDSKGGGRRIPTPYGIFRAWRDWITAPLITEKNMT